VRIARRHHGHGHLSCWRSLHGLQGRWWQRGDGSCTPAAISHDDEGDSELVKNEGTTKSIMIHDEDDIHPRKSERWTAEIKKNTRIQCGCGTLLVTPLPQLQLGHGCMSQGMSIRWLSGSSAAYGHPISICTELRDTVERIKQCGTVYVKFFAK
jgi:hypothetical protein